MKEIQGPKPPAELIPIIDSPEFSELKDEMIGRALQILNATTDLDFLVAYSSLAKTYDNLLNSLRPVSED